MDVARQRHEGATIGRFLAVLAFAIFNLATETARAQERATYDPGNLQFALPDRWSVETSKQQLTLVAPNEDGFVQFMPLQPGNDASLRTQVALLLTSSIADTVVADPGNGIAINGMPGFRVTGSGSSDATPVQFIAVAVSSSPARPVLVLAYAAQDSFPAHAPVFEALLASLRRR